MGGVEARDELLAGEEGDPDGLARAGRPGVRKRPTGDESAAVLKRYSRRPVTGTGDTRPHGHDRHRPRTRPSACAGGERALRRRAAAVDGAAGAGAALDAARRADGVDGRPLRPPAGLGVARRGRALHRRRRPHVPRPVRGRHERLLRPRAGARGRGGRPPDEARQPVPAARRGRDRRRRASRRPLRAAEVAVHLVGHAGQHRGHPPRPRADRPPDRAALRRQVPRRGRRDARRRPGRRGRGRAPGPAAVDHDAGPRSSPSTTSRRCRPRSRRATWPSCWPSRR